METTIDPRVHLQQAMLRFPRHAARHLFAAFSVSQDAVEGLMLLKALREYLAHYGGESSELVPLVDEIMKEKRDYLASL